MEALTSVQYFTRRLDLNQKLRETQRDLDHERRILQWWLADAIMLIILFIAGIVGGVFLGPGWYGLTVFSVIAGIVSAFAFFLSMAYSGPDAIEKTRKLSKEVAEIKNRQYLLEEEWREGLAALKYQEYYRRILIPQVVEEYRSQSKFNRSLNLLLQMTVIITSLLVTGLTSGIDVKLGWNIPWLAPILSLIVSLCTATIGFFKFRERSLHMQQTADAIEQEQTALELGIGYYRTLPPDKTPFAEFAERVEKLREEQRKAQQQLEQSSVSKEAQVGPA